MQIRAVLNKANNKRFKLIKIKLKCNSFNRSNLLRIKNQVKVSLKHKLRTHSKANNKSSKVATLKIRLKRMLRKIQSLIHKVRSLARIHSLEYKVELDLAIETQTHGMELAT